MTIRVRFFTLMILALLATAALSACTGGASARAIVGSGSRNTESRDVSGFDAITLNGGGEVFIEFGDEESLTIEADDNILPVLTSEVVSGTLVLGTEDNVTITISNAPVYRITMTDLTGIEVNGGASITADDLELDDLSVRIDGGAALNLSGSVDSQSITVNGAGEYDAFDLASQHTQIEIDGLGAANVNVAETLDVTINGAGTVTYTGDPEVTQEVNGLGTVHQQ